MVQKYLTLLNNYSLLLLIDQKLVLDFYSQKRCIWGKPGPQCCKDGCKMVFAGSKFNNTAKLNFRLLKGVLYQLLKLFKSRHFVLWCKNLIITTDQKSLIKVLSNKSLWDVHNPRLLNLKEQTLRYNYKMISVPEKHNLAADAVSLYPATYI